MSRGSYNWQTATIDVDRDEEFVGDDVDQFSSLVDLGRECNEVMLHLPTITSSTISIYGQRGGSEATVPQVIHVRDEEKAASTAAFVTTAGVGGVSIRCPAGGYRHIRVRCNTNQSADRAILCKGI